MRFIWYRYYVILHDIEYIYIALWYCVYDIAYMICGRILYDVWYDIAWYYMRCDLTFYHTWYDILWYLLRYYIIPDTSYVWYYLISYDIIWCGMTRNYLIHDMVLYHIWYHIIWYLICYCILIHDICYDTIWYWVIFHDVIWELVGVRAHPCRVENAPQGSKNPVGFVLSISNATSCTPKSLRKSETRKTLKPKNHGPKKVWGNEFSVRCFGRRCRYFILC